MSVFEEYRRTKYEPTDISEHQTELATSLRIPFVNSPYPRWFYVVAIVTDRVLYETDIPTEHEVRMVASFCDEYRDHWYYDSFKKCMADMAPYDIDGGANCAYFIKYQSGGWGYRKRTWERGPDFVPTFRDEPKSLPDLLDYIHDRDSFHDGISPRWLEWKAAHSDVFAAEVAA